MAGGEAIHGRGRVLHSGVGGKGSVGEEGRLAGGGVRHVRRRSGGGMLPSRDVHVTAVRRPHVTVFLFQKHLSCFMKLISCAFRVQRRFQRI